jgi:hypothetical protein
MRRDSIIPCLILAGSVALLAVPTSRSAEISIRRAPHIQLGLVKIDKSAGREARFPASNNAGIWASRIADASEPGAEQPGDEFSLENDPSRELNYDDSWEGYVGAWRSDAGGSQWSVVVTIVLSILVSVAGYWLFGRSYRS